jgi:hypothetical protein
MIMCYGKWGNPGFDRLVWDENMSQKYGQITRYKASTGPSSSERSKSIILGE